MSQAEVVVRGAREHNLKNVNVSFPRGSLTTITGVSGSGKSSLAFDTIHNEGQRRFLESLSAYARQFLGQIEKPDVDQIDGLSPTVSIDQKTVNRNPRSTVGTITEVYDHLRLLFARIGVPVCPNCGLEIRSQTADEIRDQLLRDLDGKDIVVLAPLVKDRKGEYRKELEDLRLKGFVRARIDGEIRRLDEDIKLKRYVRHTIEVVIDRIKCVAEKKSRLAEAIETAVKLAEGIVSILDGEEVRVFSSKLGCKNCGAGFPEVEPRLFSFNSPHGACKTCDGLGISRDIDPDLVVDDPTLTLRDGAITALGKAGFRNYGGVSPSSLPSIAEHYGFDLDTPWGELVKEHQDVLLYGSQGEIVPMAVEVSGKNWKVKSTRKKPIDGVIVGLRSVLASGSSSRHAERFVADASCPECKGSRVNALARSVTFQAKRIDQLAAFSVDELLAFMNATPIDERQRPVAEPIFKELKARLGFLSEVGLGYITIDRSAATLSGGESQRIRLATQVGSRLKGILYILDEPSIGLHARDNARLIKSLEELRDLGNTVVVVEHDQEMMERSDVLIDVGPGAGVHGGAIVAAGSFVDVMKHTESETVAFLSGKRRIEVPAERRAAGDKFLTVHGARHNNLNKVTVRFPVGLLSVVSGVSGSGKSTLIDDVLKRALAMHFHGAKDKPGKHDRISGLDHFDKVIEIDQSPIGRTPRSNPATYTGVFDLIRDTFANLEGAKIRGWSKGRFSFNVAGGRCEECSGAGVKVISMQFLPDVEVICEKCGGLRFNAETLEVRYREKSINDVLEMTIEEAAEFFANHKKIVHMLRTLLDVGLDYVKLGQPATTLSGGEAQRLKLATELQRPATGRTLYLLDEPTTGLHFQDIEKLLKALSRLVDAGNTAIVIEHNLDVVKTADWIVDLGPEGGSGGGRLLYEGPFDGLLGHETSHTAEALNEFLGRKRVRAKKRPPPRDNSVSGDIVVEGARTHNLTGVDVRIPSAKMTVITGVSGSGKTSLAFDTIFAEGQRRFVESLSAYARQFLGRLEKAPVDRIDGLAPAIAIDQKNASRNPRSTVATTTEIYDYLRLLFARVGRPHCPTCGREIARFSSGAVHARLAARGEKTKGSIVAPILSKVVSAPLAAKDLAGARVVLGEARGRGFGRALIDGNEVRLDDERAMGFTEAVEVWLVIDRVVVDAKSKGRIIESLESAFREGRGIAGFVEVKGAVEWYSETPRCVEHGFTLELPLSPRMFSFNSWLGSCPACLGVGTSRRCEPELLVNVPEKPLLKGAMKNRPGEFFLRRSYFRHALAGLAKARGFDLMTPWKDLRDVDRSAIMDGLPERIPFKVRHTKKGESKSFEMQVAWPGLRSYVEKWHGETGNEKWREQLGGVMRSGECPNCRGRRLRPEYLAVTVGEKNIAEATAMTVSDASRFFGGVELEPNEKKIAERVLAEVKSRLGFLEKVGLEYLTLDRSAGTLSGGEAQRIRLATQIGSRLSGVIYVLDEPTIGLHQRDTQRLLATLTELRDLGNSVIMVEHDEESIDAADWIVDMGPGAGHLGGRVCYQGPIKGIMKSQESLTGGYLSGRLTIPVPPERRAGNGKSLVLKDAKTNNLKSVDATFPLGTWITVTGPSGSGKSSLVVETLVPALERALGKPLSGTPGQAKLEGARHVEDLLVIDQSPIGRTPKSNPATYVGVFDLIRDVFAQAPAAKVKGFAPGRFSFNSGAGRCEACEGRGSVQIEMNFLADVWITCDVCKGRRYNSETLLVEYRGKTIADVLEMDVAQALEYFENWPRIKNILATMVDVGVGYMKLGQPSNTLSGGEAQRLKLASELCRNPRGHTVYVLDEPTTGLHFDDVRKLVHVIDRLVERGHTVIVIEHNLDVVMCSDLVIDLGPEGGDSGGRIVAVGTPEEIAKAKGSHTGPFLAKHMARRGVVPGKRSRSAAGSAT